MRAKSSHTLLFVSVCLIGAGVRLLHLGGNSLWLDEVTSLSLSSLPWKSIVLGEGFDRHTPPAYYLFLKAWFEIFPRNELGLRLFSVFFDSLNIALLFFCFLPFLGRRGAVFAMSLYALSPYSVYYAQDGRMYSLLCFLTLLTFYASLPVLRSASGAKPPWWLLPVVITGFYTHYYYALALASLTVAVLLSAGGLRGKALAWMFPIAIAGVAFMPWIPVVLDLAGGGGQVFRQFSLSVLPYALFRFSAGYGVMPLDVAAKAQAVETVVSHLPQIVVFAGGFSAWAAFGAIQAVRTMRPLPIAPLAMLLLPPLLALLLSLVAPMLSERYLIVSFPFFVFFLAVPLALRGTRWTTVISMILLALSLLGLERHFRNPDTGYTEWRSAFSLIRREENRPGGVVLVNPEYAAPIARHYLGNALRIEPWNEALIQRDPPSEARCLEAGDWWWIVERGTASSVEPRLVGMGLRVFQSWFFPKENGVRVLRVGGRDGKLSWNSDDFLCLADLRQSDVRNGHR